MSGLQRKFSLQAYQLEVPEHASSKANKEYTMSSQKKGFKRYTTFETKELVRTSYCETKELVRTRYLNSTSIKKTIIKKHLKAKC